MVNALTAANAYQNMLKLQQSSAEGSEDSGSSGKPDFAQMVKNGLEDVVKTQHTAESAQMNAISGKGDITDLVTAISNAEMALNTIVSVRDRAISAYQDIIRMPI